MIKKIMKIITHSPKETFKCGYELGLLVPKARVICLNGDIGVGKTIFIKGIGSALGIKSDEVISPYFNILFQYNKNSKIVLYHFDFMRLKSIDELYELNIEEIFESEGLVVIEWGLKFKEIIPNNAIIINIEDISISDRKIEISSADKKIMEIISFIKTKF